MTYEDIEVGMVFEAAESVFLVTRAWFNHDQWSSGGAVVLDVLDLETGELHDSLCYAPSAVTTWKFL